MRLEILNRGWIVLDPSSRDAVYDLVVDMGNKNFVTVQVKTMSGNSIHKFIDRSRERVSANGKVRESLDYAEHEIDWLAGYRKEDNKCFFYSLANYSKIPSKSFSVNKYPPDEFPTTEVPNRHARKTSQPETEKE